MTKRDMEDFLRGERWEIWPFFYNTFIDPHSGRLIVMEDAYRIALKRKSARDTGRLKKCGWTCIPHRVHRWINPISRMSMTKASALATLVVP